MKMYEVGGCVRDEILGVPSKDIDFSVVLERDDFYIRDGLYANDPFKIMVTHLDSMGFKIFLETPEFLTVRAQFPKPTHNDGNMYKQGLTADFVLARKESEYTDGRRPDVVEPGTLEDDLARRDFTMNAIAKTTCHVCYGKPMQVVQLDGSLADGDCVFCFGTGSLYIDPFNGRKDIDLKLIRAVGDPMERLSEDALRAVRALRFAVTKGFVIERDLSFAMQSFGVLNSLANKISDERIQVELSKMFRYDTSKSLSMLFSYPSLSAVLFSGKVSLDATLKTKGRGR